MTKTLPERQNTVGISAALMFSLLLTLFGAFPQPSRADLDSGNIAVVEADPTILQPGEDFDLSGKTVTFTPTPGGGYSVSIQAGFLETANIGTDLSLGDDESSSAQGLGFTFPFFGNQYTSVFVNSNGYVTFGNASSFITPNPCTEGGDLSTILDRMAEGLPRIAVLWNDLDPSAGGGVFFNSLVNRALITWRDVPRFGAAVTNSFQLALFPSGVITLTYGSIGPPSTNPICGGYMAGISPGESGQFLVTTLDLSTGRGGSVSAFATQEPLVQVFGTLPKPLIHISAVTRRFFQSHADGFDQAVIFANFDNALGDAFAFELTVRVSMNGIGDRPFDNSSFFGSAGRLHSVLNMNVLSKYPDDPNTTFLGTNTTLDLMGQEAGHAWLAKLRFDDGGTASDLLLGRAGSHWSFFMDSDASDMEGNEWRDNGDGSFTSVDATARFSALDQYVMGLRPAAEVPNLFFIGNPAMVGCRVLDQDRGEASCAPAIGVTATGTRRDVSIGQIVAVEGQRPSGFTGVNPTNVWHQAFILLVPRGVSVPPADLNKVELVRSAWVPYFNVATDSRGAIDTSLSGPTTTSTTGPTTTSTTIPCPISCDDGDACNGVETCDAATRTCQPGSSEQDRTALCYFCLFDRGLGNPACPRIPTGVQARFDKAHRLIEHATEVRDNSPKQARILKRYNQALRKARRRACNSANIDAISEDCYAALDRALFRACTGSCSGQDTRIPCRFGCRRRG